MVIDVYAAMADGVWLYEPKTHRLLPHLQSDIRAQTGTQDFVATAPLNLVYVAHGERMGGIPRRRSAALCLCRYRVHRAKCLFILRVRRGWRRYSVQRSIMIGWRGRWSWAPGSLLHSPRRWVIQPRSAVPRGRAQFTKLAAAPVLTAASLAEPRSAVGASDGLSSAEAARRRAEFGPNAVVEDRAHPLARIARHFWAPVPWMLETTIALQVATGERLEASMIAALLLLNVALGVFQENRADAALALLKQQLALKARVRRDGRLIEVPAADLVPGDIVQLSLGGIVPADRQDIGRRIAARPVDADRRIRSLPRPSATKLPMLEAIVRRGEAIAEIIATGARTYFGRAAELVRTAHVESSEQQAVLGVVRNLTIVNFAIIIGIVAYAHAIAMSTTRVIPLVLTALLSAVPVALPATFTLAATLGAKTLALKGVLLTRLSALARGGDDRCLVRRQDRHLDPKRIGSQRGPCCQRWL